ncbi:MAG TPA: 5-carboxymethyl-2-hydroxymuconate isomerase, partial [Paracoccaceae bacterium]|nr:5-carboxymethyl-2-hydroxymuconate isomerase [Paracoccaceae bacterium]
MPHVTIEYSETLDASHDLHAMCEDMFQALAAHPAIPQPETLKIRALPCPFSRIGTTPNSFVHATLGLLPGRDDATKADLAQTILEALDKALPDVGSLSVDVQDLG